jgi:prepilin-type N-terminal cleavage/methylation domain-containing protein
MSIMRNGFVSNRWSMVRVGFTLIELLVVIAIIAVLVGLLGAGAQMVRARVRDVAARNDITQLSASIQTFKTKHEISYLPSRIVLREDLNYGTHSNATMRQYEIASIGYLRRLWPRLQPYSATPGSGIDWNQDGVITSGDSGSFLLEGDQCLVFFLGGAQDLMTGACIGFSTSKSNPMSQTAAREPALFEFPTARLQPLAHPRSTAISGTVAPFRSFMDSWRDRPYLYFSARHGNDYNALDCESSWQWTYDPNNETADTNRYVVPLVEPIVNKFHSRDGFQIICAGSDRVFGVAGYGTAAVGRWDAATGAPFVNGNRGTDFWHFYGKDDFSNFHPLRLGSGQ